MFFLNTRSRVNGSHARNRNLCAGAHILENGCAGSAEPPGPTCNAGRPRAQTTAPTQPAVGIRPGAYVAIFSSLPFQPPDVPRTPGIRQTETQPAVSRHPAAEIPGLSRGHRPVDILAQRQHVRVARPTLKAIDQEQSLATVHHARAWLYLLRPWCRWLRRCWSNGLTGASEGDSPTAQARVKLGLRPGRSIPLQPFLRLKALGQAHRASLALLPQRPRQDERRTGAHVHCEAAQASPPIFSVLSPGFNSSIGHLQLGQPFSKIRRLQCLDIGFYQLAQLASLSRGEIADRNGLQECRCCFGCVRGA